MNEWLQEYITKAQLGLTGRGGLYRGIGVYPEVQRKWGPTEGRAPGGSRVQRHLLSRVTEKCVTWLKQMDWQRAMEQVH